ncbi:PucR family transcriptional regulator [Paenarthrobacter sp. NPDC058040]|uniref:PucR family transcriptional regulator n=1 Tax=unclassified Paenarthrobacter TaxID=2634190 RepID=UPI0036DB490A
MDELHSSVPIQELLGVLGTGASIISGDVAGRFVGSSSVSIQQQPHQTSGSKEPRLQLVVISYESSGSHKQKLAAALKDRSPSLIAVTGWPAKDLKSLSVNTHEHVIIDAGAGTSPEQVTGALDQLTRPADTTAVRQLTIIQRSLSQALSGPSPVQDIIDRLQTLSNATALIVSPRGSLRESTGPAPLKPLFEQVSKTPAASQLVNIQGWNGIAIRLQTQGSNNAGAGWLMLVSRRDGFPDEKSIAAAHMAGTLVETSRRMTSQIRVQELAIRSALFEQALALKPVREDSELASRLSALGIAFSDPLRVVVATPRRGQSGPMQRSALQQLHESLSLLLDAAEIVSFSTIRDDAVVFLANCDESQLQRMIKIDKPEVPSHIGIGRDVSHVGDIADSYTDAWLGIRSLRNRRTSEQAMSFEQFDLSTRLFSIAGIEAMVAWATEFLGPLMDKEPLMEGLRHYFALAQNINAASRVLNVHPNSLRYRLTKAEELLDVDLKDPAAISSLFLALTALEFAEEHQEDTPIPRTARERRTDTSESAGSTSFGPRPMNRTLGVALDPADEDGPRNSRRN